eukprot:COSAG01_NODE_14678_length_1422_cov_11.861678_1_plen_252_part_00
MFMWLLRRRRRLHRQLPPRRPSLRRQCPRRTDNKSRSLWMKRNFDYHNYHTSAHTAEFHCSRCPSHLISCLRHRDLGAGIRAIAGHLHVRIRVNGLGAHAAVGHEARVSRCQRSPAIPADTLRRCHWPLISFGGDKRGAPLERRHKLLRARLVRRRGRARRLRCRAPAGPTPRAERWQRGERRHGGCRHSLRHGRLDRHHRDAARVEALEGLARHKLLHLLAHMLPPDLVAVYLVHAGGYLRTTDIGHCPV